VTALFMYLKYLEKACGLPRWPMTFEVAKRAVGVMVLLLTVVLLLTPVPLSNVEPAMVISLIYRARKPTGKHQSIFLI